MSPENKQSDEATQEGIWWEGIPGKGISKYKDCVVGM